MKEFRYNRLLIAIIVIGLLASLTVVWQRHQVEKANNQVELAMEYEDVIELAQLDGVPTDALMQQLKDAGVTSLAVYETSLEKLSKSGKAAVISGAEIQSLHRSDPIWQPLIAAGRILPQDVYVVGQDDASFNEIRDDLSRRLSPERVAVLDAPHRILAAKANFEKVQKWNLGLPRAEMLHAAEQGFYVIARPSNYTKVETSDVESVFSRMAGIANISAVMFVGEEALGFPDKLPLTLGKLKENGYTLALIEHPLQLQFVKQEGLTNLVAADAYRAARVYVIPKDEQPKLRMADAIQRWGVTDQERNIRINLLRKFDKAEPGKTLVETNLAYVNGVKQELLAKRFTLGKAGVYQDYFAPAWLTALSIAGAVAAGVLFLSLVHPFGKRWQYLLWFLLSLALTLPLLKGGGTLARQMAALASAILFPTLSMTWFLDAWRKKELNGKGGLARIMGDGCRYLALTVGISLIGGLYVAALLADVRFFLEMEIFRGVKLTFVAPILMVSLTYFSRYRLLDEVPAGIGAQLKALLNYPVQIKTLLGCALVALVALVYVGRSGHTAGVPVPDIELKLRAFLERVMFARPREKEFMIGHPAFFLLVMAAYRQWPRILHYALVLVATIGQGSLVETFAHMRTPVFMSFVRGLDGMAAGIAFGLLAVVGVQVLAYLSSLLGRRSA